MQFKHPEILYALFLLLIPIIVHLFQLRRYKKVAFTNVKFLKLVEQNSRKSKLLKKWLTLLTRLLMISALVLAFAQPYLPLTTTYNQAQDTVIYLDNSFSMQAKGPTGSMLNEAVLDLISEMPNDSEFTLFTNTETFKNTTIESVKENLIATEFTDKQIPYNAAYHKAKTLLNSNNEASKNIIFISDFQNNSPINFETNDSIKTQLVKLSPQRQQNISIDSIYITTNEVNSKLLNVALSSDYNETLSATLSLFNEEKLLSKTAVSLDQNALATISINQINPLLGVLRIEDAGLRYDNTFYFNISTAELINVISINGNAEDTFLRKIYTKDDFNYTGVALSALNYSLLKQQNLIILNEINAIPETLIKVLETHYKNGKSVVIIPSAESDLISYNSLLSKLNLPQLLTLVDREKLITTINYSHPLIKSAFYSKVDNFQYPRVFRSYNTNNGNSVLSYEDGSSFLLGNRNAYLFSSMLQNKYSNFKNSPLVVPVFYNAALQSLQLPNLYYETKASNAIDIPVQLGQDDILTLNTSEKSIIPRQQTFNDYVRIYVDDNLNLVGHINVKDEETTLNTVSFNYNRSESQLTYHNLSNAKNGAVVNSVESAIGTIKRNANVNALWKWFVIFALLMLLVEMLLVKYLK